MRNSGIVRNVHRHPRLAALLGAALAFAAVAGFRAVHGAAPASVDSPPVSVPPAAGPTDAGLARLVAEVKARAPAGFHVVSSPPFVVAGDEPPRTVELRARQTVAWAVERLKKEFFERDPRQAISIWLFRDKASYEKHTVELFGDRPTTPFGYYSPAHRALIMNIATGGGTLVHEIVHPYVRENFPACPAWFNEGLGSLYEQASERQGRIVGLTNWRLDGLQQAIRQKRALSFESLTALSDADFYAADKGVAYGQARYLCYWLQEKGLLVKFYRAFRDRHADDPAGYRTLRDVLGNPDMAAFQKEWEAFVLGLRFP